MSFKLVKSVISSERVDGMHKLVLIILADYVNDSRGNAAWPSVTTVAIKAGVLLGGCPVCIGTGVEVVPRR